ncbi:MAG: hypothetical protein IPJ34_34665 [Myxococcales bacterium]|nr:hypothetical protein [Myxococcales bacterium]
MRRPFCALLLSSMLGGCPNNRDPSGGPNATEPSTIASPSPPKVTASGDPVGTSLSAEAPRIVALAPGEALPADALSDQGDVLGLELVVDVRPLGVSPPPVSLGAVPAAIVALSAAARGSLHVSLAAGRTHLRLGARAFALDEGDELVGDRRRAGWLFVRNSGYRVVPPGALRPLLAERRIDVMPLAPSRLGAGVDASVLGRAAVRHTVTTAYGVLQLDQIVFAAKPIPPKDAGVDVGAPALSSASVAASVVAPLPPAPTVESGLDGAGEALCRALLELVAAEQTLGGPPCFADRVPARAEIVFARGGGIVLDTTSIREAPFPRALLGFPRRGSKLVVEPLAEPLGWPLPDLLTLRAKGEPGPLELGAPTGLPRVALIDGVAVFVHGTQTISLRAAHYQLEWRTPLFEIVEPTMDVGVPGKAHASMGPWPAGSAAPIASVRTGP